MGLFGGGGRARRRAEEAAQRAREEAQQLQAHRDREAAERLAQQERELSEQKFRARREVERVEREKRESEDRLRKEQEAMEASLLREHNAAMQMRYDENIAEMKQANADIAALNEENRKREREMAEKHEERLSNERKEAEAKQDNLNATRVKDLEEKNKEILKTKETMHNEKMSLMEKTEKEKSELQKKHLESINELQRLFLERQNLTQEKFETETSALRNEARMREEILREEKISAEQEFIRLMKEQETMSKEERMEMQKQYDECIKSKDAALAKLGEETDEKMAELHEANRSQQARDLATLQEIQNERIEREKEVHAQLMEIQQKNLEDRAALHENLLQKQEYAINVSISVNISFQQMVFLSMGQHQDTIHLHNQILCAIPRALASEQQTSQLMSLKTKLHEIVANTGDALTEFEMAFDDYRNKSTKQNYEALEKSANEMNNCAKTLNRTVTETIAQLGNCTAVLAATRDEWRGLLRQLQALTTDFTRTSTRMLGLTKRKAITPDNITSLLEEFKKIRDQIYDLPNLNEGSVLGMIEQKQAEMLLSQQNRLNLLTLTGGSSCLPIQ